MAEGPAMKLTATVLDAPDPRELAEFQPQDDVRVYLDPAGQPVLPLRRKLKPAPSAPQNWMSRA